MTTQTTTAPTSALSAPDASRIAASAGAATLDRIAHLRLSSITLPLATPISDAKVLTGRQKPMTEVAFLFVEIDDRGGPARGSASPTPSGPAAPASSPTPRRSPTV